MRLTFKLAPETDLSGLGELEADSRLIRGREFWNLGLYDEARLEFEDLRTSISSDPVLTYRLANYLLDLGLYRSAITAARQVLFPLFHGSAEHLPDARLAPWLLQGRGYDDVHESRARLFEDLELELLFRMEVSK